MTAIQKNISKTRPVQFRAMHRQGGWTFWSAFFTMLVIFFFAYVGMQLVPVYTANDNVKNAMNLALDSSSDLRKINRTYVINKMDQQLYLDGSHNLLDYKTDLKVKRSKRKITVQTIYDREVPLFENKYMSKLALVVSFTNTEERELSGK